MHNNRRLLLLTAVSGLALRAARADPLPGEPVLRMVYADRLAPISFVEQGRVRGAWVAVMEELGRRLQLRVDHQAYPWARAQIMVKTGRADGMVTTANAERLSYALASQEVLLLNETRIFVRPSHPQFEALQAVREPAGLAGFKVTSYLGNGWLRARMPEGQVKWLRTLDDVLQLAAREPDLVLVEGERLMRPVLRRLQLEQAFVAVGAPLDQTSTRLLIARRSPHAEQLAAFDQTLALMRKDGSLARILAQHQMD
jgi:polar amino acid transport system substrate-binding protein